MSCLVPASVRPTSLLLLLILGIGASFSAAKPKPSEPSKPAVAAIDPWRLAGIKARSIGPAGTSGRVTSIVAVESDPSIVYAGAATGGVWKSTNGGLSWSPIFDDQPVHSIGSIALFQPNPSIVWVGTGEGNTRNSASIGNGIYRSLDAGKSWEHLGLEETERIYRVITHPTDPDTVWVAALGREWGENPERGVFKTTDGGKSWRKVLYVDERTGCADLAIDPRNPNKLIAAMWQFRRWPHFFRSGGPGSGLWVSVDGGEHWTRRQQEDGLPEGELGRIGVAISHSSPNIVYALVEAKKSALLRSDDGGESFHTVNSEPNIAPRPFYFADIRVDPEWPNRVYSLHYTISVSDDGGKSFQRLRGTSGLHGDHHALWIDPNDGRRMFSTDDGGIGASIDRGETFRWVENLPLAQFYHVAVDDQTPYHVMGGLQDNGSWYGPAYIYSQSGIPSSQWKFAGSGDGFDTQPVPGWPDGVYSMSQGGELSRVDLVTGESRSIRPNQPADGTKLRFNWNSGFALDPIEKGTIYYGSQFLHRSRDRGESWETISPDLTTNNPDWQRQDVSGGLTVDVSAAENHCTILAVAPSPKQKGVIWVGTDDGRVQLTKDGGKSWESVEKALPGAPQHGWIPQIKASSYDPATAFVIIDNHRNSDFAPYLYKTTDFGKSWVSLTGADMRGWLLAIEQDLVNPELLFLGSEFGVSISFDGGKSWIPYKGGLPTASVMALVEHPTEHDLVLATHGRALYIVDDITPLRELSAATLEQKLHLFPPRPTVMFESAYPLPGYAEGAQTFFGANRPFGATITFSLNLPDLPLQDPKAEKERQAKKHVEEVQKGFEWGDIYPTAKPAQPAKATEEPKPGEAKPAEKEGKKEEPSKADKVLIEVRDPSGSLIRSFHSEVKLGINRVVWDLRRRGFPSVKTSPPAPDADEDAGALVAPGDYELTFKIGSEQAKTNVTVLADPRLPRSAAQWAQREKSIAEIGALRTRLTQLINTLRNTRSDIEAALARRSRDNELRRDPALPKPEKAEKDEFAEAANKLTQEMTEREKKLWRTPDAVGIVPDNELASWLGEAEYRLLGTTLPPSPAIQSYIDRAKKGIDTAEPEQKDWFEKQVLPFLARLEKEGIKPVSIP